MRDYNEKYIVLDADQKTKTELNKTEKQISEHEIKLIRQKPCLEGFLLSVLEHNNRIQKTSGECKNLFYKKCGCSCNPAHSRCVRTGSLL